MKRWIVLLLALMMFALPVSAEPMSTFDYTDNVLEDGSLIYYFLELSLKLPAEWRGKLYVEQKENGVYFYQKASYEKYKAEGIDGGGFLFMLGASVNADFSKLPAFEYLGFSEESVLNYYLMLPSDYPAYMEDDIQAEYDAMHAQTDFVVQNAQFYADIRETEAQDLPEDPQIETEGSSDDTTDPGTDEPKATLHQARYHFEHNALPFYFYDDPGNMLDVMSQHGCFELWKALVEENGIAYPYTEEDFREIWYAAGDAVLLQIELPKPEDTPLCFRIYMAYDPTTEQAGYYTVEYDNFFDEAAILCGWDKEHVHTEYAGAAILDPEDPDYDSKLLEEAKGVAQLAGFPADLAVIGADTEKTEEPPVGEPPVDEPPVDNGSELAIVRCPELGFTTMADPAYSTEYEEGTGVYIYTEHEGSIPYVIVYRNEDLLGEPLEFIKEQFTPSIQDQYGDDLVSYVEYEVYDIGGKQLPAGLYTYRLQGYLIDMLRIFDSTGSSTVAYTAKYINGEGGATLEALDAAVRYYQAE